MTIMKYILLKLFIIFACLRSYGQYDKIKVFLSCPCDGDFIKQNTLIFDYVRDRTLADIEVLFLKLTMQEGGEITALNTRVKMISRA